MPITDLKKKTATARLYLREIYLFKIVLLREYVDDF